MTAEDRIKSYARACAERGLRMKHAQKLFTVLYDANALALTNGNVARAARLTGQNREAMSRRMRSVME